MKFVPSESRKSLMLGITLAFFAQCHFAENPEKDCKRKSREEYRSSNISDGLGLANVESGLSKPLAIKQVEWPQTCFESGKDRRVEQIVLHNTLETLEETMAIFRDCQTRSRVSIHYIVDRTGTIHAAVPEGDIAWHAGDKQVNAKSIGIEIVAFEGNRGMTSAQEESVIFLVKDLMHRYGLELSSAQLDNHTTNVDYADLAFYSPLTTHRVVTNGSVDGASPQAPQGTLCPNHIWSEREDFLEWRKEKFSATSSLLPENETTKRENENIPAIDHNQSLPEGELTDLKEEENGEVKGDFTPCSK